MEKQFSELAVGEKFTIGAMEYVKIEDVRVSCCRSINAQLVSDSNQKTFFQPSTVVVVNA